MTPQSLPQKSLSLEETLERFDPYIKHLSRKNIPRSIVSPELIDLEVDELAQTVRIKFWLALQRARIINPKAYIKSIISREVVNMLRKHKPVHQLQLDENGEVQLGNVITISSMEQNPSDQIEQEELMNTYLLQATSTVVTLPHCQQQAMICALKDQVDDILELTEAFKAHEVDIETVRWPEEKQQLSSYRSSLTVARRKLRFLLDSRLG